MIVASIFGALFGVTLLVAVVFGRRLLQMDEMIQDINGIVSEYVSFLQVKTTRGTLVDSPEVRDFHNRTIAVLAAMKEWAESISTGRPVKRRSNAELMGSDPEGR